MNMKVVFQDYKEGFIDSAMLDQMISENKIKMFVRSDGLVQVGEKPVRGSGGRYDGVERRGSYGIRDYDSYSCKIAV